MMSIVYDMQPHQCDLTDKRLRRKPGHNAAEFLSHYSSEVKQEFDELRWPTQFSIGIEYKLVLTKKQHNADIELSTGLSGRSTVQLIEVPKDPSKSYPNRQKEVVEKLKEKIPSLQVNQHDI